MYIYTYIYHIVVGCLLVLLAPQDRPVSVEDEVAIRDLLTTDEAVDIPRLAAHGGFNTAAFPLYSRILSNPKEETFLVTRTFWVLTRPEVKAKRDRFLEPAISRLSDPNAGIRRGAVTLLAQIGSERHATPIAVLLSDRDITISYAAAKALASIGDRQSLVALDVWLNSDSHRDHQQLRDNVRKCREELQVRLDRAIPAPKP